MSTLKDAVRERFDAQSLDSAQLAALQAAIANRETATPRRRARTFAYAAAISAVVLLASMVGFQAYDQHRTHTLMQAIAVEVADNHLKLKPLEVEASDFAVVRDYFDRLEFQLVAEPAIAGAPGDRLLGGRYCTIQGSDAAQLRVATADGALSTWYEAALPPGQLKRLPAVGEGDAAAVIDIKGLRVRLWREHGIVFAEARPPPGS